MKWSSLGFSVSVRIIYLSVCLSVIYQKAKFLVKSMLLASEALMDIALILDSEDIEKKKSTF